MLDRLKGWFDALFGPPTEDLYFDLWVTQEQIDGQETVTVQLPIGKRIELELPPMLAERMRLRLAGVGRPQYRDVYLNIRIGVPEEDGAVPGSDLAGTGNDAG
jgi:hypothetical protein